MQFNNRHDAGRQLARLLKYLKKTDTVIYALPRGGVVVASEIALDLSIPLDLICARKIGHPQNSEFAIAAVTEEGDLVVSEADTKSLDPAYLSEQIKKEIREAKRRSLLYLTGRTHYSPKNQTAILVDDGIATGLSLKAALKQVKKHSPKRIIVAVPVAPSDTIEEISSLVNKVFVLHKPKEFFGSIGSYYQDFTQVTDEEVLACLSVLPKAS